MRSAAAFAIIAALLAAADTLLVKLLSRHLHAFEIAFFRSLFGLLLILPWLIARHPRLRSVMLPTHFLRAAIKYAAMVAFFFAVANAPIADVTAIAMTAPVLSIAGAWITLRERRRPAHLVAVLLGLAGALIIARPGLPHSNPYLLLAFAGAAGLSSVLLLLKHITGRDSAETVLFWNLVFTTAIALGPCLFVWTTPSASDLALLAVQGGLSAFGILMMARATHAGAVSQIVSFDFLRLPASAALAYVVLGEPIRSQVWFGGLFIILAVVAIRFERH